MQLESKGHHDFYMALDAKEYFEQEYSAEEIVEAGYVRPLRLATRDVLVVAQFIEDAESSHFDLSLPDQDQPDHAEEQQILRQMSRVLGCGIDTSASALALADDPIVGPMLEQHQGFKRVSRADFYEDAMRLIIRTRISHEATKQRMVKDVREGWGTSFEHRGVNYWSYPRPEILAAVDPADLRDFGISKRKGEYITGLAKLIADGELDVDELEALSPQDFYDRVVKIRGIGPSSAQFLVLRRDRPDAIYPIEQTKSGANSNRMLKWLLPAYGLDIQDASRDEIDEVVSGWEGHEAIVAHYFYYNWLMGELEKQHQSSATKTSK